MPEIRLVKRYPHIKDEDVTSIFQEGYIKGFENGRKGAIPIEWIRAKVKQHYNEESYQTAGAFQWIIDMWYEEKEDWEKENERV